MLSEPWGLHLISFKNSSFLTVNEMREKRGQFFILAAVIIAVAIVGLTVVYNTVNTGDSSKKFYSYSKQVDQEAGNVVDYALFTGDNKVADFINESVKAVLKTYPEFDVFACYTKEDKLTLICDNYGEYDVTVFTNSNYYEIPRGKVTVDIQLEGIGATNEVSSYTTGEIHLLSTDRNITVKSGEDSYPIDLTQVASSSGEYYFIFRAKGEGGETLADVT